ncbi:Lipoprotein-anchoring transpeptidase ErfK/SrfK [Brevibacterium sp. 239c]|uniref:L,D-transpeptidase n=1 Tax=Brevibacterium sp. 239c TaxID=1965356 RepID=UPI000C4883F4|nr:Ig-like domain-containing protein [Brevibacterium sp. 239c]SMX77931.1 Lipoprotein-anchoring transpeptidase ErfK/SrfK [Brevibacterium sp. 239c]
MSPKKIHGAVAALSALALLTACTPSGSDPDATRNDAKSAEAPAEPVFRVASVSEDDAAQSSAEGASSETSDPTSSSAPTSTSAPTSEQIGEVVESGAETDASPGERISLSVENASLSDISITESDHPRIKSDPGVFFDTAGTALKAADQSKKSSDTAESSTATSTEDAKKDSAEDKHSVTAPDDAAAWLSAYDLVADSTYELSATATSAEGEEHEFTSTVNVSAGDASPMSVRTTLSDDQTVGVGAPIILSFGSTVAKKYRDDVEHRLSVKVTDKDGKKRKVEGSWAWLPDDPQSRLHFRPKEFWPAHSKVSVDVPLKNVPTTADTVGQNDLTLDFDIGRKQVVKADAKSHRMVVTRDGREVMNFPASLGAAKSPSYNGTHVVMSKAADYTMTSEQWDYETDVRWAVRIHNNGEFIHAAPWSTGVQGSANVSHGCVNLSTERAKQYYDSAIFGDPVEITGSDVNLSTSASDISDWVYDWDDWKKLSALD